MKQTINIIFILLVPFFCKSQNIGKYSALADFDEFVELLQNQSSYFQLSDYDFENHYQIVKERISNQDSVHIHFLAHEIGKVIAETVDRHASVKVENLDEGKIEILNLHFPFSIAPLNGKAVALIRNKSLKRYEYYSIEYPYIKKINGIPIIDFIKQYSYKRKKSPKEAMLYDGIKDLRDVGELFFKQNELSVEKIDITLTNGITDKTITLALSNDKNRWSNIGHTTDRELINAIYFDEAFDYNKLDEWIEDSIAYFQIPSMFSYAEFTGLEKYLRSTINKYRDAKAVIMDLRGNGGGTRDILNTLAEYIVLPDQSPWVANVAYIRNDQQLDEDIESMSSRYLYSYYSERITEIDRKAIDEFENNYKSEISFDSSKFSKPFYMILKSNETPLKCPVFVLVDERSFSAASVFTSALKGLANVKIVGVTTNGSSGRSLSFNLKNSNIRVKLSTMLSFQRNGKTLDGNGTQPDLVFERDDQHILGIRDSQLHDLVNWIKEN